MDPVMQQFVEHLSIVRSPALTTTSASFPMTPPIVVVDDDDIRHRNPGPCNLKTN